MKKKIKIVFICVSELTQRYFDWWALDELSEKFDMEYWDISEIAYNGFRAKDKIERPFVVKIKSIEEFEQNLKKIPKDSVITPSILENKGNYKLNKLLSHYFPKVCYIHLYNFIEGVDLTQDQSVNKEGFRRKSFTRRIKELLYKSPELQFLIKNMAHPSDHDAFVVEYYRRKTEALFEHHDMWNVVGEKYYVNSVNVNQYMKAKREPLPDGVPEKYIVYIDQFFPYHNELKISDPAWDADEIAKTHYVKINKFLQRIEKQYQCPVIIAVHPVANYTENPYDGRLILKWCTEKLVIHSQAVLMHNSGSLAFIMLANKPMAILVNDEYRKSPWMSSMKSYINQGLYSIDLEKLQKEQTITIPPISKDLRDRYMEWIAGGEIDEAHWRANAELIAENYVKIYHEMYD